MQRFTLQIGENHMSQQPAATASFTPRASRSWLEVVLWVLQIASAAMFFLSGFSKLAGAPPMVALFTAIGIGQWFRYLTGALEVLGALLLLVPRLSGVGALLLAGVMTGAIAAHLFVVGGNPAVPVVLLVVTAGVAWSRRERTLSLVPTGQ
jgi:uncharacterized membrane protein YphA (DoxX/SURF4 family)